MKVKIGDKIFDSVTRALEFVEALCKMYDIECPEIKGEAAIDKLYRLTALLNIAKEKVVFLNDEYIDTG